MFELIKIYLNWTEMSFYWNGTNRQTIYTAENILIKPWFDWFLQMFVLYSAETKE